MITGPQIRAARALLRWTSGALARRSTVLKGVIVKAETADGVPLISPADLETIKTTFENAGIDFIDMTGLNLRVGSPVKDG